VGHSSGGQAGASLESGLKQFASFVFDVDVADVPQKPFQEGDEDGGSEGSKNQQDDPFDVSNAAEVSGGQASGKGDDLVVAVDSELDGKQGESHDKVGHQTRCVVGALGVREALGLDGSIEQLDESDGEQDEGVQGPG